MCGTIDRAEMEEDVEIIAKGPLAPENIQRLKQIFGHVADAIRN